MTSQRCASCGSRKIEKTALSENNYGFRCGECGYVLSMTMDQTLCEAIDLFLESPNVKSVVTVNEISVNWQYFRKKYPHLERCVADEWQKSFETPHIHDAEATVQYLSKLYSDKTSGELYEISKSDEQIAADQTIWQEQVEQRTSKLPSLVKNEKKMIEENHLIALEKANKMGEESQQLLIDKVKKAEEQLSVAEDEFKSVSVLKVADKLKAKEKVTAAEKACSDAKEARKADFILQKGKIQALEKRYLADLADAEKRVMKNFALSESPTQRINKLRKKADKIQDSEETDYSELIALYLPKLLQYYGKITLEELRIVIGSFIKEALHDKWTVVSAGKIEKIIKTECADVVNAETTEDGIVYYSVTVQES